MAMTPEELIDRLNRLDQFEARLAAATNGDSDNPPAHDAPPPLDTPTLRSGIATQERILSRLEKTIHDTPPSRSGSIEYSRMLTSLRETTDYLATLRARLAETDPDLNTADRPRGYLVAWSMTVCWIDALKEARDNKVITQAQGDHLWWQLIDNGILDHTGYSPTEALEAHRQAVLGQMDLDAEEAARSAAQAT